MNIKRVIAATALTVVPLIASPAALAVPAAPQGAPVTAAAAPAQATSEGVQYANTILNKINGLRSSLSLQPAIRYQGLDAVARDRSEQQTATNNMSHRPDFTSAYPSGWATGSENVAWRTTDDNTGAQIFNQWLNSPGHYKNMTGLNINSIGIGFAQTSDSKWYTTQNFTTYNINNLTLTPSTTTTTNTTTTMIESNTPPKTTDTPPTDIITPSPTPTPETTPSTPPAETTAPALTAPPTSETTTLTSTPSAPTTTMTTQTATAAGTPAKPSATPIVVAPHTTPAEPALATTGPSIAIAIAAAGLLGTGAVLVIRRRQASWLS